MRAEHEPPKCAARCAVAEAPRVLVEEAELHLRGGPSGGAAWPPTLPVSVAVVEEAHTSSPRHGAFIN